MQKLFENWKRFLLNESIEDENKNFLISVKNNDGETFAEKFDLSDKGIEQLISIFKPLRNSKILSIAGTGAFGFAFKIDNNNILKLYSRGVDGGETDHEKYKRMQTRQFSGEGILNEPAIYEVGTARIRDFSGDPINMYFVEMGKVITFKDWVNRNNLDYSQWDEIIYVLFVFYEQNPSPSEVDSKTIMRFVAREYTGDIKALPQGTLLQLIKSTVVYYHKNGILKDLHPGNLGVIPSNIEGKEDIFVFFDV